MLTFTLQSLHLPLRYTWKISRNSSDSKTNFIVTASDGTFTGQGEVAPNVRYGESPESIRAAFEEWQKQAPGSLRDVPDLQVLDRFTDLPQALRFGLESACLHYLAARQKVKPFELLGLSTPQPAPTFFSLPIMPVDELEPFYRREKLDRFPVLKIKVASDQAPLLVKTVAAFSGARLVVDANEAFRTAKEVMAFIEAIREYPVIFIEQPLPSALREEQALLKASSPLPVFADESVCRGADVKELASLFDGVNVKLMKTGGYLEAIRQLREARALGLKTMLGCMVETSLGISSALQLQSLADHLDLDGFLIVKDDPFNQVAEEAGKLRIRS